MTGLSLTQAATRTGKSRRTIGRLLADGKIPGAEQKDGVWSIPLEGLATAGLLDDKPKPSADVADDSQPLTWRERALIAEDAVKRLEDQTKDLRDSLDSERAAAVAQRASNEETKETLQRLLRELAARSLTQGATEPVTEPATEPVTESSRRRGWFGRK